MMINLAKPNNKLAVLILRLTSMYKYSLITICLMHGFFSIQFVTYASLLHNFQLLLLLCVFAHSRIVANIPGGTDAARGEFLTTQLQFVYYYFVWFFSMHACE
jgi:hypothetical protein